MKKRLVSVLLFALTVSAGAAFVLYQLISQKVSAGSPSQATPMVKVFVATRNVQTGELLKETDLQLVDWPTERSVGTITKKEDIINRGAIVPIQQGWPFSDNIMTPKGAGAGFASTIPKGMRAFAVHVNEVVGVAGFAIAGMRVDILVSGTAPGTQNVGSVTRTLLQNVEVLSAGQNYQKDAEGKPVLVQVVNLLVTPENAEILNLATEQRIQLVLRNPLDKETVKTPGAYTSNLFEGGAPHPTPGATRDPSLPKPVKRVARNNANDSRPFDFGLSQESSKPQIVTMEVINGNRKVDSTFQNPEVKSSNSKAFDLKGGEVKK